MMRRLLMSFALLLAACSAEPPADMTAYYAKPDGIAFTVAAAGNGDARVEAGDMTLIRNRQGDFLIQRDARGAYAARVDDYLAVLDENLTDRTPPVQPDYTLSATGAARVAGIDGVRWNVHPRDTPSLPAIDAVVTYDDRHASIGRGVALYARVLVGRNSRSAGSPPGRLEAAVLRLFDRGTVLRFGQVFALDRVESGAIPAERFAAPAPLDRAALKRRMAAR